MHTQQAAFSLTELLVGLSVTALLTTLTTPTFISLLAANESRQTLNAVTTLMQLARTSAVSGQAPVTLCLTDETGNCQRAVQGMSRGIAFIDGNTNRSWDEGEPLLHYQYLNKGQLRWRASLGRRYLVFRPSGRTRENGTLYFCPIDNDSRRAWNVVVSRTGRAYVTRDGNGDGVREDSRGRPLQCPP